METLNNLNIKRYEKKLKNGIRLVHFYKKDAPISISAILKSGSIYETKPFHGIAHFLEHMIMNGSEKFPTKDLLAEHIESVGGRVGAWTSQDSMGVDVEISDPQDISRAVDIFNATLAKPMLDKKTFENEKNVIIKEIQKMNSNPTRILAKTVKKNLLKNTPFEFEILGYEETISSLKYEDLLNEYNKLFDKSRITFISVGDIEINILIDSLSELDISENNTFESKENNYTLNVDGKIYSEFFDIPQTHIFLGFRSPKSFTTDLLHLNMLGSIIASGRTARLIKRLRYKKGLVYDVGFGKYGGIDLSNWGIITNTTENEVQNVVNEILDEINDLRKNGITENELDFIKNKSVKSLKRQLQTSNEVLSFHAQGEVFAPDKYFYLDKFINETRNTTLNDINLIIKKYFKEENWKLVTIGRTKSENLKM